MTLQYLSGFIAIVFIFIVFTLRAFYFAFIKRQDPLQSVMPMKALNWIEQKMAKDKDNKAIQELS